MRGRNDLVASAAYQPEPSAAAAARRFVRQTLRSWDIAGRSWDPDRVVDDAVLLTSELVTNAVVHAGTPLDVVCRLTSGELEVAVRDRHPTRTLPDIPQAASISAERGRGLLLPSALASSWGVTYARTAKAVWFRMSLARDRDQESDALAAPPAAATAAGGACDEAWAGTPAAVTATSAADMPKALPPPAFVSNGTTTSETVTTEAGAATARAVREAVVLAGVTGQDGAPGGDSAGQEAGTGGAGKEKAGTGGDRRPVRAADDPAAALRPDLGTLSYDELLRHTVETARDVVTADAAYALVADEDGELRVRAAAGVGVSESLFAPSVPAVLADRAVPGRRAGDGRAGGGRHLSRPVRRRRRGEAAARR